MKYFTREHEEASQEPGGYQKLRPELDALSRQYREELKGLTPRLSDAANLFFNEVSLHDGTLLILRVGDDIDKRLPSLTTKIVNKRLVSVSMDVLNYEETTIYTLSYGRIHRVLFDFPTTRPWCLRCDDPGGNAIDYWMFDELTAVNDLVLRHEVQFSSGSTLLVDFELFEIRSQPIHGREALPFSENGEEQED